MWPNVGVNDAFRSGPGVNKTHLLRKLKNITTTARYLSTLTDKRREAVGKL